MDKIIKLCDKIIYDFLKKFSKDNVSSINFINDLKYVKFLRSDYFRFLSKLSSILSKVFKKLQYLKNTITYNKMITRLCMKYIKFLDHFTLLYMQKESFRLKEVF